MIGMMTLIMIFLLGLGIGALIVLFTIAKPQQKLNEELLEHIEKCEYERWSKFK